MNEQLRMAHLHLHTTYSFLDGYGTPEQIAERLVELGHTAAASTDHGNTYSHVAWQKALRASNIKPLFGCEMYVVDDIAERTRHQDSLGADGLPHATIIAADEKGYNNLLKLVAISYSDGFYGKPRVDWQTIAKYQEGLVVLSGCVGGYPSRLIRSKGIEAAWEFVRKRQSEIEDYYIELVPEPDLDICIATMPSLIKIANSLNIPMVVTADAHFPREEDHEVEDLMLCVGIGKSLKDETRTLKLPSYQYICSAGDLLSRLDATLQAAGMSTLDWLGECASLERMCEYIKNSHRLADQINFELPKASKMLFPGLGTQTADEVLWENICTGLNARYVSSELPAEKWQEYVNRATYEYGILTAKGFADYILMTTDIVQWAKNQNSLVMCRGSAGGSVVLWLIGCSETDPIKHGLSFERFYDVTRDDPPDIDVDFEHSIRPKVLGYIYGKYGEANCAQLAAISYLKAKNAVLDAARAFSIPDTEIRALTAVLDSKEDDIDTQLDGLTGDAALVLKRHPELRIVNRMVGQARHSTMHACGMIIAGSPIDTFTSVIHMKDQPRIASVDKAGVKTLGVLKVDLLSVASYDVIAETLRMLGRPMDWLYTVPLDDTRVFMMIRQGQVSGVFQLDGAASNIAKQIHVDKFEEVYAASALCRPGPNVHVDTYVKNKMSPGTLDQFLAQIHPVVANIVRETYGVLLYQEQVMRICRELASMEWKDVSALRKRIASATADFHELGGDYKTKFIEGCAANGVSAEEIAYWWDAIKTHGFYSFNKSHAVTYGIVGYWMMYLKVYHPAEFYSTYLRLEGQSQSPNEMLIKNLIREWRQRGGQVKMIDPTASKRSFSLLDPKTIIGGWENVKGIGPKLAEKLLASPMRDWLDVSERIPTNMMLSLFNAGVVEGPIDTAKLAPFAGWMPVEQLTPAVQEIKDKYNLWSVEDLYRMPPSNESWVCGYITLVYKKPRAGKFHGDVHIYVLEDTSGMIMARSSLKTNASIGVLMKTRLAAGQFVAMRGYFRDGTLYVAEFMVLQEACGE